MAAGLECSGGDAADCGSDLVVPDSAASALERRAAMEAVLEGFGGEAAGCCPAQLLSCAAAIRLMSKARNGSRP